MVCFRCCYFYGNITSFRVIPHAHTRSSQAFLWDLRYSLLNRAELLPAFVMSVRWSSSEQVQELYDLLDLWAPPTCVQALQLLDRRFMDPKVRAYAVHCLEDLPDDELALYMLQLCQQLKFERFAYASLILTWFVLVILYCVLFFVTQPCGLCLVAVLAATRPDQAPADRAHLLLAAAERGV